MTQGIDTVIERIRSVYGQWRRDTPVEQMRADWDRLFQGVMGPQAQADQPSADQAPADRVQVDWVGADQAPAYSLQVDGAGADQAGAVPVVWVRPEGVATDQAIIYFHGGGYRVGSVTSHLELMTRLAKNSGVQVLGVSYRLAPEYQYPAPLQDAISVWTWLQESGYLPTQLALAGDSAGGGLALVLMLALLEHGQALPQAAYLLSAWTDLSASGESYQTRASADPIHQRAMILAMAKGYLGEGVDPKQPLVSPLYAAPAALAALPPLLLQVGDRETVLSDSVSFAQRVNEAGGQAQLEVWPEMIHVFQQFPNELPEAVQAVETGGRFLAQALSASSTRETQP